MQGLPLGALVGGRYRVDQVVGRDGTLTVYGATDQTTRAPVALKVFQSWSLNDERVRAQFIREAQATFALRSPHTVQMLDVGALHAAQAGTEGGPGVYVATERVVGPTLREVLRTRGIFAEDEAKHWIRQACEALNEAHTAGIVYGSLTLDELVLAQQPTGTFLKVLDLGIAKMVQTSGSSDLDVTTAGQAAPAPEQMDPAGRVDARTDIFALGIVLHQLLTGRAPLEELGVERRMHAFANGLIPSPRAMDPRISAAAEYAIMRCLKARPDERFATATELGRALEPNATVPVVSDDPFSMEHVSEGDDATQVTHSPMVRPEALPKGLGSKLYADAASPFVPGAQLAFSKPPPAPPTPVASVAPPAVTLSRAPRPLGQAIHERPGVPRTMIIWAVGAIVVAVVIFSAGMGIGYMLGTRQASDTAADR